MPLRQRIVLWQAACVQLTTALVATQELWPPLAQQDPAVFGGPKVPPTQTLEPESLELSKMLRDPVPSPLSPMMRGPNPSREESEPPEPYPTLHETALSPHQEWEAPEPFSTLRDPVLPPHREPELPEPSPTLHGPALSPQQEWEPPGPSPTLRDLALVPQQGPEPPEPSLTLRGPALAPQQELEPPEPSPTLRGPALAPQQELDPPEPSPTLRGPALAPQQGPEPTEPPEPPDSDDDPLDGIPPNYGKKHLLDKKKYPNAKCLDGTQGGYYFSPGTLEGLTKFYLFRMGGGFCKDFADCQLRQMTWLGSTSRLMGWPKKLNLGGKKQGFPNSGFNRNSTLNPLMWNWNHVYMIYCDGAYFAGTNSTPSLVGGIEVYFHGAEIQNAILDDLNEKYGLRYASDVILGGCSAGGIATYVTSNSVFGHPAIARIPRKAGFAFSGFFLDKTRNMGAHWYFSDKKFPWFVQNISGSVDRRCMADNKDLPVRCFIPEIAQAYLRAPLFIWESVYDSYQLEHYYGVDCTKDPECIADHKRRIVRALDETWSSRQNFGGFLDGCGHHCEDSDTGNVNNIRPVDSTLPLQALAQWYSAYVAGLGDGASRRIWVDGDVGEFPCKDCCPKNGEDTARHFLHDLE